MNIHDANAGYEAWLSMHTVVVKKDLLKKKEKMAKGPFPFFRGTFYRWTQLWPHICPELLEAPAVRAIGDLHLENFGTWRDIEGRLVWGVNDFDEAYRLPYAFDLVRLVASIILARRARLLVTNPVEACERILSGYTKSLKGYGRPFVLAEEHPELREMAIDSLSDPVTFWQNLEGQEKFKNGAKIAAAPKAVSSFLKRSLPDISSDIHFVPRTAGVGSLGRRRVVAIAEWNGGKVAREAKALVPSACVWAKCLKGNSKILYETIVGRAVRVPDPCLKVYRQWIVRRLAPDCVRIDAGSYSAERNELILLHSMGGEVANIHLGSRKMRAAIIDHLKSQQEDWLLKCAKRMVQATIGDWKDFVR